MTRAGWYLLVSAGALLGQSALPVVTQVAETGTDTQLVSPGAFVYVIGTGFGTNAAVTVNGIGALVLETTPTALTIQMPTTLSPGPGTMVVTSTVGSSAPFAFLLSPVSPSILTDNAINPPTSYFTLSGNLKYDLAPGDLVEVPVNGLGPQSPPPTPVVLIDGNPVPVLAMSAIANWNFFLLGGKTVNMPAVEFRIPNLTYGHHGLQVQIGGVTTGPLALDLFFAGLVVSPTGLTFNAAQGGPTPPPQTTTVLSGVGNLNFSVSPATVSGGMWLTVSPLSGSAQVGQTGVGLQVSVNPSGLSAGAYYGTIQVTAPGLANSPQIVSVVLNVSAAGANIGAVLSSAGLIFVGSAGGATPPAQMVSVYNPAASLLSFTSVLAGTNAATRFHYNLATGSIPSGQTVTETIGVTTAGLSAGAHTATITMIFSDGSTRVISLLLLVTAGTASAIRPVPFTTATGCKPTLLLPVFLGPGNSFYVPAAWPTPILVSVVDDCGSNLLTGSVHAEFSNGDPVITLASLNNGTWAGSWPPGNARPGGITITAIAAASDSSLVGEAQITGGVSANPNVPVLSQGGIVDLAAYGSVVSPGSLIAVFGSQLAAAQAQAPSLPLPILLSNTTLYLGAEPVPLIFSSSGQVNAMMPYDVTPDATHPLIAQVGNALSAPQNVLVASAHPAVFTVDQSGTGAGVIVHGSTGALITSSSPAQPGEVVVIYCTGLGAVMPSVPAGTATPLNSLTTTVNTVRATIGGAPANILFAGISPGSTGLYQVNAVVPTGLPNSDSTPVILSVGSQASPAVTMSLQN